MKGQIVSPVQPLETGMQMMRVADSRWPESLGDAELVENHPHIVRMHALDVERYDGAFARRRAVNPQAET